MLLNTRFLAQCSACQSGENFKTRASKRLSCWTEASVVRNASKIANCVSARPSSFPSLALCEVSSDQCGGCDHVVVVVCVRSCDVVWWCGVVVWCVVVVWLCVTVVVWLGWCVV